MATVGNIHGILLHQVEARHAKAQVLKSRHDALDEGANAMREELTHSNEFGVGRVTTTIGLRVVAVANENWGQAVKWLLATRQDPLELGAISVHPGIQVSDDDIDHLAANGIVVVRSENRDTAIGADQFAREFIERRQSAVEHVFTFLSQRNAPKPTKIAKDRQTLGPR